MDAANCPDFSHIERTAYEQQFPTAVINPTSDNPDENWAPMGAAYYGSELVLQSEKPMNQRDQLALLDWHPLFTGHCPNCERAILTELIEVSCDCGWEYGN